MNYEAAVEKLKLEYKEIFTKVKSMLLKKGMT